MTNTTNLTDRNDAELSLGAEGFVCTRRNEYTLHTFNGRAVIVFIFRAYGYVEVQDYGTTGELIRHRDLTIPQALRLVGAAL